MSGRAGSVGGCGGLSPEQLGGGALPATLRHRQPQTLSATMVLHAYLRALSARRPAQSQSSADGLFRRSASLRHFRPTARYSGLRRELAYSRRPVAAGQRRPIQLATDAERREALPAAVEFGPRNASRRARWRPVFSAASFMGYFRHSAEQRMERRAAPTGKRPPGTTGIVRSFANTCRC